MTNSTLSILVSIVALLPLAALAALAQNIQTGIQNPGQANYQDQLNHNDYRIPITSKD